MFKYAGTFLLLCSSGAYASMFSYDVTVNTSTIPGSGTLYFQFNPGPNATDSATATISNFSGAVLNGTSILSGDASGTLASELTIANTGSNNDALQALTFGSAFSFHVSFTETFSGTATSGSVFNFGIYQDDGVSPLLTTQPDGYSVIINLDTANQAAVQSTTSAATVVSAVPEPSTLLSLGGGLAGLLYARLRKTSRGSNGRGSYK
jgi:hypothetical protein